MDLGIDFMLICYDFFFFLISIWFDELQSKINWLTDYIVLSGSNTTVHKKCKIHFMIEKEYW